MENDKQKILKLIDELISKRKSLILKKLFIIEDDDNTFMLFEKDVEEYVEHINL